VQPKIAALTIALVMLSGCDSTQTSDWGLYYQAIRQSVATDFASDSHVRITQAAAIQYATIGYRLNDGPEQILVLATDNGVDKLWTSAAHVVIVTHGGRIVRTVGLPEDISAVTGENGQQLLVPAEARERNLLTTRLVDFPGIPAYGVEIKCRALPRRVETIVILGHGVTTQKVDEICRSDSLNWSFTDTYWIDPQSTLVWRSIQHVGPKEEKIEIETLRPPG
jgi:hypothetical protein